jgi:hypothetical protein
MKQLYAMLIILVSTFSLNAQVAVNTDGSLPDPSAMLDIKSTTRGMLVPRVTTALRLAFPSPADGLLVYDTNTRTFWYYMGGTGWNQMLTTGGTTAFAIPFTATVNSPQTLFAVNNTGTGMGLQGTSTGATGIYGSTGVVSGAGVLGDNFNGGEAITGRTTSVGGTPTGAVVGRNDGPGYGVYGFVATDNSGNGIGVLGRAGINNSTGAAGQFENLNSANTANTLNVTSNGQGVIPNHAIGNAGNFFANNTSGVGAGVRGEVNSIFGNAGTAGVYGTSSGTGGYGGYFEHSNASGFGLALFATTAGQGVCGHFETVPAANAQTTLEVVTAGTGSAGTFTNTNTTNTANILNVTTTGPGVIANHALGNAGNFFANNTSGVGAGVRGEVNSIFGNAGTAGVYGVSSGSGGYAGYFDHTGTTGFGVAVQVVNHGQGTGLVVDQEGTAGDLAIFQRTGTNMARISRTGRGFFNGGTQNNGADVAEAFDVEGNPADYEPGDVLIISTSADRTVVRSGAAYSTLVAGVYATKPGVLLTELSIDGDLSGKVPMGVVGVIPTKVCGEGGPIQRGDILVTAGRPGYAMRADINKLKPGQAIGKALQPFTGATGKINVLVNVK